MPSWAVNSMFYFSEIEKREQTKRYALKYYTANEMRTPNPRQVGRLSVQVEAIRRSLEQLQTKAAAFRRQLSKLFFCIYNSVKDLRRTQENAKIIRLVSKCRTGLMDCDECDSFELLFHITRTEGPAGCTYCRQRAYRISKNHHSQ